MVEAYLNDPKRSKVAAYRSAYKTEGWSAGSIQNGARKKFEHPLVRAAIEHADAKARYTTKIDAEWVLKRLAMLAEFNIRKFLRVDDLGNAVYDFSEATDDDWYCIDEYTVEALPRGQGDERYETEKIKLKAQPKLKALELIGRITSVDAFARRNETVKENRHADMVDALANLAERLPS